MDERGLCIQLETEGFVTTYVWQDRPYASYADHTHPVETAHIILSGEMTITMDSKTATYGAGDRVDVPANAVHSAQMGAEGCRYIVGERGE
jgi:quercetin dioxygenase-like cupin family protein